MNNKPRKQRVAVNEELYTRIKKVVDMNTLTNVQIGKLFNISDNVVGRIKHSADYSDYGRMKKAEAILARRRAEEKTKREQEAKQAYQEAADEYVEKAKQVIKNEEDPQINDVIEELKEINMKLGQLVTIWETEKNNERWEQRNNYRPF